MLIHFQTFSIIIKLKSDNGNVYKLTNGTWPASYNYPGRFSNGIVWPEYLSKLLNIPLFDYAYGSATADETLVQGYTGANMDIKVPGVVQQVQTFVSSKDANADLSNAIATILISGNDYFFSNLTVDPKEVVSRLAQSWETLYQNGIRNFLIISLPKLSNLPAARDPSVNQSQFALIQSVEIKHNNALCDAIEQFTNAYQDVKVYEFDMAMFFDWFKQKRAASLDITNFTNACVDFNVSPPKICANPETYFYWDAVHLTTKVHGALADSFQSELLGFGAFDYMY
ncbi:4451_t:CDS:2 [Ambispora gerdemannii]|uniref:4451_t:CDS:1 n=1 Tax=Ambispora gerdemannii TaxID=144530 RepID=A0A9N8Z129_9GLOM|nr:4451_t:CDS:2 [Ambispora gerdemannii]